MMGCLLVPSHQKPRALLHLLRHHQSLSTTPPIQPNLSNHPSPSQQGSTTSPPMFSSIAAQPEISYRPPSSRTTTFRSRNAHQSRQHWPAKPRTKSQSLDISLSNWTTNPSM